MSLRCAAPLAIAVLASACFDGEATVGAICSDASDCGPKQGCRHELCGRCGDGEHLEREVCYSDRREVDDAGAVASLRVADLDDDNRDDIVVVAPDGSAAVLFAQGGDFTRVALPSPIAATVLALGDVDGDGDIDVVLAGELDLAIVINAGDRTFTAGEMLLSHANVEELGVASLGAGVPARLLTKLDYGALAWRDPIADSLAHAIEGVGTDLHLGPTFDWNGDELADIAVVDHRSYLLTIVRGTAGGYEAFATVEVGRGPVGVIAVDRNDDGRLDFLTRDSEGHSVTIVDGTKDLGLAPFDTLAFEREPAAIAMVDADVDGKLDILVGTEERLELWRAIGGRYPEGVELSHGAALQLGAGRFRATPLFDVLVQHDAKLERLVVTP